MRSYTLTSFVPGLVAATLGLGWSSPAWALQPVAEFVQAASRHHVDLEEAAAEVERSEADRAMSRLDFTPNVTVTGGYTRNQYQVKPSFPDGQGGAKVLVITPYNQLDAAITVTQPLVDVGSWLSLERAKRGVAATRARRDAREREVVLQVVQSYYQLVASRSVVEAATRSLTAAEENQRMVEARVQGGVASPVDAKRAEAEVLRVKQNIADATYAEALAARAIETQTGLVPQPGTPPFTDTLNPEPGLANWLSGDLGSVPSVVAARDRERLAEADRRASHGVLFPALNLVASERVTNATGFLGKYAIGTVGVTMAWRFDAAVFPAIRAKKADAALARVASRREQERARDQIHAAWHQVEASLAKARAARGALEASKAAASTARQRYDAGTALLLEVITTERDVLTAEVARIQADADLTLARQVLRLRSGVREEETQGGPS